MADTLRALSQRREAFWIGLTLLALGALAPRSLPLGGIELSRVLLVIGAGILLTRHAVGVVSILSTTARAGLAGYREGTEPDR